MTEDISAVLSVRAGRRARTVLAERGFVPELFTTWLGASGGPKWLVLYGLDQVLAERWLRPGHGQVALVGSSIGSWRHACLAQRDPLAAIERFREAYVAQRYRGEPTPAEVSEQAAVILEHVLGSTGVQEILAHEGLQTHVVVAHCRGMLASERRALLALGLGAAAASNFVSRRALGLHLSRAMFHTGVEAAVTMHRFATHEVALNGENLHPALMASGAIPLVLAGVANISGAPPGVYRDGGVVDYHFDFHMTRPEGLCLYPHFSHSIVPGWFDKYVPWRRLTGPALDDVVMLGPSQQLVAGLPNGKIPDRSDFRTMKYEERLRAWQRVTDESRRMGDALLRLLDDPDPARHVTPL
ncbi:MAG: patatin-like phospholipase family protein [Polyangiales bacterium]